MCPSQLNLSLKHSDIVYSCTRRGAITCMAECIIYSAQYPFAGPYIMQQSTVGMVENIIQRHATIAWEQPSIFGQLVMHSD